MIEDLRLVGVSPQLQPFEPSSMDALCLSFGAHDESNDVMQRQFPGPQKPISGDNPPTATTSMMSGGKAKGHYRRTQQF
jgi:hypothetical protein